MKERRKNVKEVKCHPNWIYALLAVKKNSPNESRTTELPLAILMMSNQTPTMLLYDANSAMNSGQTQ